VKKPLNCISI